jgi:hypothetical protein
LDLAQGTDLLSISALTKLFAEELKSKTSAPQPVCWGVAQRIVHEVQRICDESSRIQASGAVGSWAKSLGQQRVEQCLRYYNLGSEQGRVELHSTLSAIVYRYITPAHIQTSYQARLGLIEDFLQGFYLEVLTAFRRENQLDELYQPRTLLELAEFMAFSERYGKRRITLSGQRSQQLLILRAQTFCRQQPPEVAVDIEQATDFGGDSDDIRPAASHQRVREEILEQANELPEPSLRGEVVEQLLAYLKERNQDECADYFALRLLDLSTQEIESLLNITPRERDYLQQRFKYHLLRFALSHQWELVHEWLGAGLANNLGLTPQQWEQWYEQLSSKQIKLLQLKQQEVDDTEAARLLGLTSTQFKKYWTHLLELAWEIRNL